jgi:hypothetical protein
LLKGDSGSTRGWVLIDDGSARRFGPALAWAWGSRVEELHVLVDGDSDAAGVVARRAAELAAPPSVWAVNGRSLTPARPAPAGWVPPSHLGFVEFLRQHGAQPLVEHGVLRGEVLGLEVARVVDGRLEIGVGRHDRAARAELGRDVDPDLALSEVVAAVSELRRFGAPMHPANTLARSRWLRAVVCARPALAGATDLDPVAPPLPAPDLTDNSAVPCVGVSVEGRPLVAVCSTGVDPDLIPTAADSRALHLPEAELVVVVPEGDDHPLTTTLADALARPARVRTVPRGWEARAQPVPSGLRATPPSGPSTST